MNESWQELASLKIDHWEPVIESTDRTRTGKVWIYYKNGKTFAKRPIWNAGKSSAVKQHTEICTQGI